MHDLVIRNGLVVDGSGAPGRAADVAIDGGRSGGRQEIDADGLVVTPGFVDIHTHYDVSALVPHGAVRAYVMGERGGANAEATELAAGTAASPEELIGIGRSRALTYRTKLAVSFEYEDS